MYKGAVTVPLVAIGTQQSHQKNCQIWCFLDVLGCYPGYPVRALNPSEARSHQWQEMSASTDSLQTPSKEPSMSVEISGAGLTNKKNSCLVQFRAYPKQAKSQKS